MPDPTLPPATRVLRAPVGGIPLDHVVLTYDDRMLRRKRLVTLLGQPFLVDLPETVSLDHGDAFGLADGRMVAVIAACEALMEVRGDLARLAWHIGNRHAPCQIEADRLLIRQDRVLRQMLQGLGAVVSDVTEPFRPEGGAYGMGRTLGHSHGDDGAAGPANAGVGGGASAHLHDHSHGNNHAHGPGHSHPHDDAHDHHHLPPHAHDHQL